MTIVSLLVPTRGRPDNIRRFADSVIATAYGPVEVVWRVDQDDLPSVDTVLDLPSLGHVTHALIVAPRRIPAVGWNEAWAVAAGDIYGLMADDIVMHTAGWDQQVRDAFAQVPDGIVLVYGRDGFRDQVHASHPFLHRRWADTLGYATPTYFSHEMNDVWLNDVAEELGRRRFLPDMVTRHLHPDDPSLGVTVDDTYLENRMRVHRDRTHDLYVELADLRAVDVEKLRQAIQR